MPEIQYVPPAKALAAVSEIPEPVSRVQLFADIARFNTLYMIMRAGSGHIGSSFSAMDIVSWLYLQEMAQPGAENSEPDWYFSSKGHDAPGQYAVMLGLGLLPEGKMHQLRQLHGLPGHPDVGVPGMITNTGSLGMGISKAKGMVHAARLDGKLRRVFVLTGDGELQEGQIWESLISAANRRMGEITVIVDHNKIQSDTWVKEVSDLGDLEAKFAAFGWEVARIDGHDLGALAETLARFRNVADRPKVIIADTIKGRGISFMESTAFSDEFGLYKYHSGAPAEENYRAGSAELWKKIQAQFSAAKVAAPDPVNVTLPSRSVPAGQRLVGAYAEALVEAGRKWEDLVVLDGDLMLDCGLIPFKQHFPDRFIECGIAEMDMVSQAGGLALAGKLPIVHSFACFLSTRPNEQIYNNATEHSKVIYVGSLAGLVPGGPGHSHQSVRDISALAAVPELTLLEPCCESEVAMALEWAIAKNERSTYLRLVSIPVDVPYFLPKTYRFRRGQGCVLKDFGKDFVIIGYGPVLLTEGWDALQQLHSKGLNGTLINLPWLNTVDAVWLESVVSGARMVISLDNHYTIGGQGDTLARALTAGTGSSREFHVMGVTEVPVCGTNPEVLAAHGLNAASIVATIGKRLQ